jgi:hypothetical protein
MTASYFTRLTITINASAGDRLDDPGPVTTTISADMEDCSVHAYFKLFEQVLQTLGFSEENIATGGAQLAFNECRSVSLMRKVAHMYDLKLDEDINADDADSLSHS